MTEAAMAATASADRTSADREVALVTGAGQGIGLAIALRLAADGLHVCINDLDGPRAASVVDEILRAGGAASAHPADVSDPHTIAAMFDDIESTVGPVDVLVNNAGIGGNAAIRDVSPEYWDRVRSIDLDGVLFCSRRAIATMRERRRGRIVTIASRAWLGWWGQAAYAASKAGVVGMSRALAVEVASRNIRVNVVAPGLIDTPMLRDRSEEALERLLLSVPIARLGTAGDIAGAVSFLAGERSRSITGQVLYVCGGKSVYAYPDWKE